VKWLARAGLVLGLLYVLVYGLGYAVGVIPSPLRDLALIEVGLVEDVRPQLQNGEPPRSGQPYLRVTVSSSQNLIAKGEAGELNIYALVADCADADATYPAFGPFHHGLHVSPLHLDSQHPGFAELGKARADLYAYQLFVPIRGRLRSASDFNRPMPEYDLRRGFRTLCVRIGGGNMMGGYFRSNEIRILIPGAAE
jgi:hypothetical protein